MLGFVAAMESEAEAVLSAFSEKTETLEWGRRVVRGKFRGEPVLLVVSGVGKANAAAATQLAIADGAKGIVNAGVCGGFDPSLKVGDVCEVSAAVQYDFDLAAVNGTDIGVLDERKSARIPLRTTGRRPAFVIATGDHFNDAEGDLPLLARLGCGLRDMECGAVAQVCERAGIPCLALKCVTNVIGSGATGQFRDNLAKCLATLSDAVRHLPNGPIF